MGGGAISNGFETANAGGLRNNSFECTSRDARVTVSVKTFENVGTYQPISISMSGRAEAMIFPKIQPG